MNSGWLWAGPLLLLAQTALVWDNLRVFTRSDGRPGPSALAVSPGEAGEARSGPPKDDSPLVSLLVPARNEAAIIGACVGSLLAQAWSNLEVLVLDDDSEDGTGAIARAAAGPDPRFRLLSGSPLPSGWAGKAHACAQLAEAARGEWLVFVDADTLLAKGALARALSVAEACGADLLSFWPRQITGSLGERWMMPLLSFVLLAFLPLRCAEASGAPSLAAANGQCLVFRRAAYARCGGHAARRGDWVEDVGLARSVKAAGGRVVVVDAGPEATCRMYRSWDELWQGFRKNLYPAFGGRVMPFLAGLTLVGSLHALPWLLGPLALLSGHAEAAVPLGLQAACGLVMRALIAERLGQSRWSVLAHGAAVWALLALALDSWRGHLRGAVRWKGRSAVREGAS